MTGENGIKRNLRIGVVGLGHCGGAMAMAFALCGYEALAFNTSDTDLRGLDLPDARKFHISLKGKDGVGRDRSLGGEILRANSPKILDTVHQLLGRCDHYVLCGGLAGGTGGNLGKLAGIISELGKPATVIGALPRLSDGVVDKYNAIMALAEIAKAPRHNLALVDNARISVRFPQASLANHYRLANNLIAGSFDYLNKISVDALYEPIYAFDGEDFRKAISSRGTIIWATADEPELFTTEGIAASIDNILYRSSLWPRGYDGGGAQRAALVVTAPDWKLKELRGDFWEKWTGAISQMTKGCGCYYGLFRAPNGVKPRISLMLAGMDFPAAVGELLENSRVEVQMLSRKLEQDFNIPEAIAVDSYVPFEEEAETAEARGMEADLQKTVDLQSGEKSIEEGEMKSMAQMEAKIVSEESADGSEKSDAGMEAAEVEAIWRKRRMMRTVYTAAAVIIIAGGGILAAVKSGIMGGGKTEEIPAIEAVVVEKPKSPAALVKLYPQNENFYLVYEKKEGRLELFNSNGMSIKIYHSYGDAASRGFLPAGIYFVEVKAEGENLPFKFYPMAFKLSYPGPMDTVKSVSGGEIYIGGCPETVMTEAARGGIALAAADMVELSSFLREGKTPVMIYSERREVDAEEITALRGEIEAMISGWVDSWNKRDWEKFSGYFGKNFMPRRGSRSVWEESQRNSFRYNKEITVKIDKTEILRCEGYILVQFEQDYQAGDYRDFGLKRLYIVREEGGWKIGGEEWMEIKDRQ